MTTMELWEMQAQQAYASRDPWKRMDMVPDVGPVAGSLKNIPGLGGRAVGKVELDQLFSAFKKNPAWTEADNMRVRAATEALKKKKLRPPTREEVEMLMKTRGYFGY